jgi:hypothetical protein
LKFAIIFANFSTVDIDKKAAPTKSKKVQYGATTVQIAISKTPAEKRRNETTHVKLKTPP